MIERTELFIGGAWVPPREHRAAIEVENPTSQQMFARIPQAGPADVAAAVAAATAAAPGWAATDPKDRAGILRAVARGLDERREDVAATISREMGAPLKLSRQVQVGLPVTVLTSFADLLETYEFSSRVGNSLVVREPVGVVGAITPWNYPLHQVVAKVGGALAAGATVVLKPSELAPLSAFTLMEVLAEAGLPPGVVNLVTGAPVAVGEALVSHPGVDMVSFTGSTRAGRRVATLAAEGVKRVALELGGKSANVVLPGADLTRAVKVGVANAFLNSGQTCTAWTRLLVPLERHDEAVELAAAAAAGYSLGDPFDEATRLGPLVSAVQRQRVRDYIDGAIAQGARVVTGGPAAPEGLDAGYYVRPTVLANVTPEMTVAREEVFGPVLAVLAYTDEADALRIANDTDYGLAGAVWSDDEARAVAFARGMRTGQVDINGGRFNPLAPFGGYRHSGYGRELGQLGLEEFTAVKSLQF